MTEKKDPQVSFRVSEPVRMNAHLRARREGVSLAHVLRKALHDYAHGMEVSKSGITVEPELLMELVAVCQDNNLDFEQWLNDQIRFFIEAARYS